MGVNIKNSDCGCGCQDKPKHSHCNCNECDCDDCNKKKRNKVLVKKECERPPCKDHRGDFFDIVLDPVMITKDFTCEIKVCDIRRYKNGMLITIFTAGTDLKGSYRPLTLKIIGTNGQFLRCIILNQKPEIVGNNYDSNSFLTSAAFNESEFNDLVKTFLDDQDGIKFLKERLAALDSVCFDSIPTLKDDEQGSVVVAIKTGNSFCLRKQDALGLIPNSGFQLGVAPKTATSENGFAVFGNINGKQGFKTLDADKFSFDGTTLSMPAVPSEAAGTTLKLYAYNPNSKKMVLISNVDPLKLVENLTPTYTTITTTSLVASGGVKFTGLPDQEGRILTISDAGVIGKSTINVNSIPVRINPFLIHESGLTASKSFSYSPQYLQGIGIPTSAKYVILLGTIRFVMEQIAANRPTAGEVHLEMGGMVVVWAGGTKPQLGNMTDGNIFTDLYNWGEVTIPLENGALNMHYKIKDNNANTVVKYVHYAYIVGYVS